MEIKKKQGKKKMVVNGNFSQEFYMSRNELADFLRNLANQVEGEESIRIISEDWILPFKPVGYAQVDIDLDEDELEIEIEFKKSTGKLYIPSTGEKENLDEEKQEHENLNTG
jgi:amphi-Trp domain-containing protein